MARTAERKELRGLEPVRESFRAWRETKRQGERIPERLWEQATELAREHGVYPVCRALGLDFVVLRERAGEQRALGRREATARGFVELPREVTGARRGGCVVELAKANGTRMRIELEEAGSVDWARLKEAFLGG